MKPHLVAVDWGTSGLRLYALDDAGEVMAMRSSTAGMARVGAEPGAFFSALAEGAGPDWLGAAVPFLMCGMVGARGGWHEAPYVSCPAKLADVAAGIERVPDADCSAWIVPGVDLTDGDAPDVMRGEETQIFGALAAAGADGGLFILPGTHSKWVRAAAGSIASFATYMTGDFYAALSGSTVLAKSLEPAQRIDVNSFARGARAGAAAGGAGELMHAAFGVRALGLFGKLASEAAGSYLSGLLIGAELAAGCRRFDADSAVVIGDEEQVTRYRLAGKTLGISLSVGATDAAAAGIARIAAEAGMLPPAAGNQPR